MHKNGMCKFIEGFGNKDIFCYMDFSLRLNSFWSVFSENVEFETPNEPSEDISEDIEINPPRYRQDPLLRYFLI